MRQIEGGARRMRHPHALVQAPPDDAEHCTKEVGIALLMADHFLRPAAGFLIDAMRAVEMPTHTEYPHSAPARMA